MNSFLKNLLGLTLIIALGGILYIGYMMAQTYDRSSTPTNFRSFTVQGEGRAVSVPDIASFSFEVITEGDTDVASLQSKNAEKMNAAIAFVGKAGIDKKDIKTQQYSISPRYQTTSCTYRSGDICPPASISGYTVKQSVFVKIRDFKLISTLLSGVVENGANSVGQIQFSLDNTDELENTARAEAIKKAQEKAEKVAQAGGFKLGRLLEISEGYSPAPYYARSMAMMDVGGSSKEALAPAVEAGSEEVNVSVSLRYEIQ